MASASIGKQVGGRVYVHVDQISELKESIADMVASAAAIVEQRARPTFNVIRIDDRREEIAFLSYPELGSDPFPALDASWRVHVPSALVTYRRYSESLNPPILHRSELLLPCDHPARADYEALTTTCEGIGLFENTATIGFQRQWHDLIRQRGYELVGMELRPLGNAIDGQPSPVAEEAQPGSRIVSRHLTALSRSTLSAPMQSLIRDGLLRQETRFFDYGCGKGDDLATLRASGFEGSGWDPHFRPDDEKLPAETVNLGFVINVIENLEERVAALEGAYGLATQVLAVAAMVTNAGQTSGRTFADGVLTSRNTFQKYYTQAELQQFIEAVLEEDAYPAAPGVFYVFRDRSVEQAYLLRKSSDRSRVARARLAGITHVRAARPERPAKVQRSESPEALACLGRLWEICLELGRFPELDEIPDLEEVKRLFRSPKRALDTCVASNDPNALKRAQAGRSDDILVMLALHFFGRRRRFNLLERRLQHDIRTFFGSFGAAEAKARDLLFSVRNMDVIRSACEEASSLGLGWLEPGHSLQLHTSLVERLPAPLRVYLGCATAMAGNITSWDLVKAHIASGKVSLLLFDDFLGKPLPSLQTRVKVRLRDQDLDIFEYADAHPPTLLYHKSRYINEEIPRYAEQVAFEETLDRLGLFDLSGYGPTEIEFNKRLRSARWEIHDFSWRRCTHLPGLDDRCGATFTYRDLIECGETWEALRTDNKPRSPDTYNALNDLATKIIDPVVEYFGAIKLTYGFACQSLTKHISGRIDPRIDQHASCELSRSGQPVCSRLGAAVDFLVEYEDMHAVAKWIAEKCPFDRMYLYGVDKPLHVSIGPDASRKVYELANHAGRRVPRVVRFR